MAWTYTRLWQNVVPKSHYYYFTCVSHIFYVFLKLFSRQWRPRVDFLVIETIWFPKWINVTYRYPNDVDTAVNKVHTARHKQIQYTYKKYENHNLMSVAKAVVMETKIYVWNTALTTGGSSYMDVEHTWYKKW